MILNAWFTLLSVAALPTLDRVGDRLPSTTPAEKHERRFRPRGESRPLGNNQSSGWRGGAHSGDHSNIILSYHKLESRLDSNQLPDSLVFRACIFQAHRIPAYSRCPDNVYATQSIRTFEYAELAV